MRTNYIEDQVRKLLPWYLAPRFNNTITSVSIKDKSVIVNRNVEVYTTSSSPYVFIPIASMMLYVPYLNVGYTVAPEPNEDKKIARIVKVNGSVGGYLPNGKYAKFTERVFADKIYEKEIEITGKPSDFSISMVARVIARIESAKYFASKIKYTLEKTEKWKFDPIGKGHIKAINIAEGNAMTKIEINTTFFDVIYKDYGEVKSPGIVAGVSHFFKNDNTLPVENSKVKDYLIEFAKRISDVGKSFTTLAILHKATRSSFSYVIGEAEIPDSVKRELVGKDKPLWHWITGVPVYRGVRGNFYLDPNTNKVIMTITFHPFYPPASVVLNYPPFHLTPLSAMVNERMKQLKYVSGLVESRLRKRGIEVTLYPDELEPLSEAGVTFDELRNTLKKGYPYIYQLERLLEKMDKVSYLGDVSTLTLGKIQKIDEMLISSITPKKTKQTVEEPASDELEEKVKRKRVSITL